MVKKMTLQNSHPSDIIYNFLSMNKNESFSTRQLRQKLGLSYGETRTGINQLLIRHMINYHLDGPRMYNYFYDGKKSILE